MVPHFSGENLGLSMFIILLGQALPSFAGIKGAEKPCTHQCSAEERDTNPHHGLSPEAVPLSITKWSHLLFVLCAPKRSLAGEGCLFKCPQRHETEPQQWKLPFSVYFVSFSFSHYTLFHSCGNCLVLFPTPQWVAKGETSLDLFSIQAKRSWSKIHAKVCGHQCHIVICSSPANSCYVTLPESPYVPSSCLGSKINI